MSESAGRLSAYYQASIAGFLETAPQEVLGRLASAHAHVLEIEQRQAWEQEIGILAEATAGLAGDIFLEFDVPRLGSRLDAVVISGPAIFPIEFKCGEASFKTADYNQVWDYALDLRNFHAASHSAPILPVLVATRAEHADAGWLPPHHDGVRPPRRCNAVALASVLRDGLACVSGATLDATEWGRASYQPTPTIIEAAQALYARHSVEAISRHDAENLRLTSSGVEEIIDKARSRSEKAIVFVTGVPGAGKTLVGLNVAARRQKTHEARSVYLSGNGPLVSVLQEALTRDEWVRLGGTERKGDIRRRVKLFIQNVHHFRDDGLRDPSAPFDHVVIFDEAQRAWNKAKTANFMRSRKGIPDFDQSEPEFLISYLDRHKDWAVVVCLVGGGQEIYTGEAGIAEWLNAIRTRFPRWQVHVSPKLTGSEYGAHGALEGFGLTDAVVHDNRLHLAASLRSFRSERVSALVGALLERDIAAAKGLVGEVVRRYPICLTRDLERAKGWIRQQARGSERYGLVASSEAQRLKPHAIDIRVKVDPIHWFLNGAHDTRSSYYLEDAATEFQVQGLELDWVCVTWDADLRLKGDRWLYRSFHGHTWKRIKQEQRQRYLLNAYRVLLTRARQGMAIFVAPGDARDPTRLPEFYDETYEYLKGLGIAEL